MAKAPSPIQDKVAIGMVLIGFGLAFYSAGLLVLHLYQWLRWGFWPRFTTFELWGVLGLGYPTTRWAGVQRIIEYVMASSAASTAFWAGVTIAILGSFVSNDYEAKRRALK